MGWTGSRNYAHLLQLKKNSVGLLSCQNDNIIHYVHYHNHMTTSTNVSVFKICYLSCLQVPLCVSWWNVRGYSDQQCRDCEREREIHLLALMEEFAHLYHALQFGHHPSIPLPSSGTIALEWLLITQFPPLHGMIMYASFSKVTFFIEGTLCGVLR